MNRLFASLQSIAPTATSWGGTVRSDPDFDFAALFSQFDTILFGRRTFDAMVAARRVSIPGMKTNVFSQTLMQEDHPQVAIVANDQQETLALSRRAPERISGYAAADRCSAV